MSAIRTTEIAGDLSATRNITVGGKATARGNATVGHNLTVGGWLDAKNIKGVNKGLYQSEERLNAAYPLPRPGWYAFVGDTLPAKIYIEQEGKWAWTGEYGGEHTIDCDQYSQEVDRLLEDYADVSDGLKELDRDVHGKATRFDVAFKLMNGGERYANFDEFQAALDEMYNKDDSSPDWRGRWVADVWGVNCDVYNYRISPSVKAWVQVVSGGITIKSDGKFDRSVGYKTYCRTRKTEGDADGWSEWKEYGSQPISVDGGEIDLTGYVTEEMLSGTLTYYPRKSEFAIIDVSEAVEYNGRVYTWNEQGLSLDDCTTDDNLIIVTNQGKICKRYTKVSSGTGSGWGSSSALYVSVAGEINNCALYRTPDGAMYVHDILTFTFVPIGSNAKGYKVETENNLLVVEDEDGGEWVCGVTKRVAPATPTIAQTTRDVEVGGETVNAVFTITCATAGAEIYYSAGKDSDPTKTGTKASKVEIAMSPNNDDKVSQTVRLASKLNGAWSAVSDSIDLVANFKVCQPKVFVLGTKYDDNRDVEIKCATQGASVKYTYGMNIDVPYTIGSKINFTDEVSVTAKATKTNYKDSDMSNEGVVTLNYPKTYIGDFNGTSITLDEIRALSKPLESDGLEVEKSYSFSNKNGGYIWVCQTTTLDKDNLFYSAADIIPIGFASAKEVDVGTGSGTIKYYCYRSTDKQKQGATTIYLKS